ncbi:MAG: LysR family transcriptional regulator [Gammaproteobacteria bacterium]|nr:LysR family transcriptional regulator [Gammaproteobacteria bacterium]
MLNFKHLRYFHAVAHEGNLTRAARRMNVSQSAVSIQIRQLEERLGHELFERRGRELLLTEAGRIALAHADTIFTTGDELVATLGQHASRTRPILRVGALATLSRNFQLAFLEPLLAAGEAEIVLRSGNLGDLLARLGGHQLDVVLSNVLPPRDAGTVWVSHLIDEQPVSLVAHPDRLEQDDDARMLLERCPVLLPTVETDLRSGIDALLERLGVRPRIAAEVDDMAMLRLLTRADAGVAILPPIVVRDELAAGTLVEVERLPSLREPFYAVTATRQFPNPLLRDLLPAVP